MALPPLPWHKAQFPWEFWSCGNCDFAKPPILLAVACTMMCTMIPSQGASRIMDNGLGVLKILILLGLNFFAVMVDFLAQLPKAEINHGPMTSRVHDNYIHRLDPPYQTITRGYLDYVAELERLVTASQTHTGILQVPDDSVSGASVRVYLQSLGGPEIWFIRSDGKAVRENFESFSLDWPHDDSFPGVVDSQSREDIASNEIGTTPGPEPSIWYSINEGDKILHPSPSSISSNSQGNWSNGLQSKMTKKAEPSRQSPDTVRLKYYSPESQHSRFLPMNADHSDWLLMDGTCCQLNLQATGRSENLGCLGTRLKLVK
ncbi:hypothetical protein BKA65DRAFT_549312 [Rhexocercosporidium sp. MPI-PUGE-AT-0058]|nr:hypothetical protein BKA65DRAFT_549312 [Rhexocercosporidium sp. MPI-PUGE-AT-0058]